MQSNKTLLSSEHAAQTVSPSAKANLTGASYVIGKLLGEIWDDPCMERDEFRVASVMCFEALVSGASLMTLDEILSASGLKLRRGKKALDDLAAAGFVRALMRGDSTIVYELRSSLDLDLNS